MSEHTFRTRTRGAASCALSTSAIGVHHRQPALRARVRNYANPEPADNSTNFQPAAVVLALRVGVFIRHSQPPHRHNRQIESAFYANGKTLKVAHQQTEKLYCAHYLRPRRAHGAAQAGSTKHTAVTKFTYFRSEDEFAVQGDLLRAVLVLLKVKSIAFPCSQPNACSHARRTASDGKTTFEWCARVCVSTHKQMSSKQQQPNKTTVAPPAPSTIL